MKNLNSFIFVSKNNYLGQQQATTTTASTNKPNNIISPQIKSPNHQSKLHPSSSPLLPPGASHNSNFTNSLNNISPADLALFTNLIANNDSILPSGLPPHFYQLHNQYLQSKSLSSLQSSKQNKHSVSPSPSPNHKQSSSPFLFNNNNQNKLGGSSKVGFFISNLNSTKKGLFIYLIF